MLKNIKLWKLFWFLKFPIVFSQSFMKHSLLNFNTEKKMINKMFHVTNKKQ